MHQHIVKVQKLGYNVCGESQITKWVSPGKLFLTGSSFSKYLHPVSVRCNCYVAVLEPTEKANVNSG